MTACIVDLFAWKRYWFLEIRLFSLKYSTYHLCIHFSSTFPGRGSSKFPYYTLARTCLYLQHCSPLYISVGSTASRSPQCQWQWGEKLRNGHVTSLSQSECRKKVNKQHSDAAGAMRQARCM